jgi:hypothetical protein
MKKIFVTLSILMLFSAANACEICGCGLGNYYIGILPQFSNRFIGVRYHFNSFHTRLTSDPTQFSNDFYQTVELWGGWNIGRKWQVLAFVPYNINKQVSDEGTTKLNGLGDVALLVNYNVFESSSKNKNNKRITQQLWLGAGVKAPTGKFEIEDNDPDVAASANRQLGSGSTDFMLNAMYNVRINKLGINTTLNYKQNTINKVNYRFGNKFAASSFVYYAIASSGFVVSPNLGLMYEKTGKSELQSNKIDLTGGTLLRGSVGTEIGFNKISVGFNVQLPVAQNFAENQTKEKVKGMVHVSFTF